MCTLDKFLAWRRTDAASFFNHLHFLTFCLPQANLPAWCQIFWEILEASTTRTSKPFRWLRLGQWICNWRRNGQQTYLAKETGLQSWQPQPLYPFPMGLYGLAKGKCLPRILRENEGIAAGWDWDGFVHPFGQCNTRANDGAKTGVALSSATFCSEIFRCGWVLHLCNIAYLLGSRMFVVCKVALPPAQVLMGDLKMLVGNIGQLDGVDPEKPMCRIFLLLHGWSRQRRDCPIYSLGLLVAFR